MTKEQFLQLHGSDWANIRRSALYADLLATLRGYDPARLMPGVEATSATEHAPHLLGRIAGFNLAVNLLESGIVFEEIAEEPEATYPQDEP